MNITLTINSPQFEEIGAPICNDLDSYIPCGTLIPTNIQINKTYYKIKDGKLTAFRILAYSLAGYRGNVSYERTYKINALVQYPNSEPMWIKDFINLNSKFYLSKDAYIESAGNSHIRIEWKRIADLFPQYAYAAVIGFKNFVFTKWNGIVGTTDRFRIKNFIRTQDGFFANLIAYKYERIYLSKEECIYKELNNLQVDEFADDEPNTFNITIRPNAPKYTTIRITAE